MSLFNNHSSTEQVVSHVNSCVELDVICVTCWDGGWSSSLICWSRCSETLRIMARYLRVSVELLVVVKQIQWVRLSTRFQPLRKLEAHNLCEAVRHPCPGLSAPANTPSSWNGPCGRKHTPLSPSFLTLHPSSPSSWCLARWIRSCLQIGPPTRLVYFHSFSEIIELPGRVMHQEGLAWTTFHNEYSEQAAERFVIHYICLALSIIKPKHLGGRNWIAIK